MSEVISGALVIISSSSASVVIYFFVPNFISPIFYYVGIESKRIAIKRYVMQIYPKKSKALKSEVHLKV